MSEIEHQKLFKEVYQNDKNNLTQAIQTIRDNGGSVVDCVKVLKRELNLPLNKADALLWETKVWDDIKDYTFKLRDEMFKAIEEVFEEE